MTGSVLHEFEEDLGVDLGKQVEDIALNAESLTNEQAEGLWTVLAPRFASTVEYGADFDVAGEVALQIAAVQAMRRSVMTDSGMVKSGVGARQLKEVVSASNTLLQTLMKTHEKILSYDRQRAIEEATMEVVRTLPEAEQATFFTRLEELLEAIK